MTGEEMTVLYYIANLVLISRLNDVKMICEKNLMLMIEASSFFKANVTRYLALCLLKQHHDGGEFAKDENEKIMSLLEDSYNEFKKSGCHWGMGIAKHMLGKCYLTFTGLSNFLKSFKSVSKFSEK